MMAKQLTHVDSSGRPSMVDVGAKQPTARSALAEARVRFPAAIARRLKADDFRSAKGPVLDTAIIAGTMAAKRTHELIPFCHPLAIESCRFEIAFESASELVIRCEVTITSKTGVEMEALTAVSVAALTVYDMCKALSHEILIADIRLIDKAGGKRTIKAGNSQGRFP
jgi:cyclic pyranopterin phosphate synthase